MITLLTGENSFEIARTSASLVADFQGQPEKLDGEELTITQFPNLLTGATLFADKRLVIVRNLSGNKAAWDAFGDWCEKVDDAIHLVLVDVKPDKRTHTYKQLKKSANVIEHAAWTDRDIQKAVDWVMQEAKKQGWELNKKSAQLLVERVGVDQWQLDGALRKLSVVDDVSPEVIMTIIDAQPKESVFDLFEAALKGDRNRVSSMIRTLELTEDPYMVFGLLTSQAFQLAALAFAEKPSAEIASDIGAHPFALSKLSRYAKTLGQGGAKNIIVLFSEADSSMKLSVADPWLIIEKLLIKCAK